MRKSNSVIPCCGIAHNMYNYACHLNGIRKKVLPIKKNTILDFDTAKILWSDDNRVEIHVSYPTEDRWIIIGKIDKNYGLPSLHYAAM